MKEKRLLLIFLFIIGFILFWAKIPYWIGYIFCSRCVGYDSYWEYGMTIFFRSLIILIFFIKAIKGLLDD